MVITVFAGVIVLCVVQLVSGIGVLDTLRNGIGRQKITVKSTLNRLQRHSRDFSYNLRNRLSNAKLNSMQQINDIVNPALKSIEDATQKSTSEGKVASQCYEAARISLRESSQTGYNDLEACRNEALNAVSSNQDNIDSSISAGQQVISYFDAIFPSCFTTNVMQMQSCIVGKLPEGTELARTFTANAETVINSSNSASSNVEVDVINCYRGPVSNVRDSTTNVKLVANACIAAL